MCKHSLLQDKINGIRKEVLKMKCERCGEHSARKHGLYRNKAGFHQKWKCRLCGTTWHDETVHLMGETKEETQ